MDLEKTKGLVAPQNLGRCSGWHRRHQQRVGHSPVVLDGMSKLIPVVPVDCLASFKHVWTLKRNAWDGEFGQNKTVLLFSIGPQIELEFPKRQRRTCKGRIPDSSEQQRFESKRSLLDRDLMRSFQCRVVNRFKDLTIQDRSFL